MIAKREKFKGVSRFVKVSMFVRSWISNAEHRSLKHPHVTLLLVDL
jgi:hypothetical protein